jgi:AmiR/NasT family two-component response regulator
MNPSLRIAVADDEPDMRKYFQKCLPRLGHQVVAVAANGRELVEQCRVTQPDLVVTDIKMPEMDGIEAANAIFHERPVPVILISAFHDSALIRRAEADHVMSYLVKPIKQQDLEPAIALAVRRFEQFRELRKEVADVRQAMADRKVIERAKGILMKQAGLEEADAFRRLQKQATEQSCKLVEVARIIVGADPCAR